jgi:DNA polymerase-3 subunit beta
MLPGRSSAGWYGGSASPGFPRATPFPLLEMMTMARKTAAKQAPSTPTASLHAADLRATLPILASLAGGKTPNIRLDIGSGGWQMQATDGSTWLTANGPVVQVIDGMRLCLSPGKLREIVDRCSADTIEFFVEEAGRVSILAGKSTYTLGTSDPDAFPVPSSHDHVVSTKVPGAMLADAINRTQFACDPSSVRFALGGLHIAKHQGVVVVEATDTRRVARCEIVLADKHDATRFSAVLPQASARLAARILGGGDAILEMSPRSIRIACGQWVLTSPTIEGRFPDINSVLDKLEQAEKTINVDAQALVSLCRQASICTTPDSRGVDFVWGNDEIVARSIAPEIGQSEITLPCDARGPVITQTFDPAFIAEWAKTIASGSLIEMRIRGGDEALVLRAADAVCVVMPMTRDR